MNQTSKKKIIQVTPVEKPPTDYLKDKRDQLEKIKFMISHKNANKIDAEDQNDHPRNHIDHKTHENSELSEPKNK